MSARRDERRWPVRMNEALLRARGRLGFPQKPLDAERIILTARRKTGREDLGPGPVAEALDVLATSFMQDAAPSPLGVGMIRTALTRALENRLRILDALDANPAIREQTIDRPVFVLGPPRTGTTLLFNLLAQDPGARPLMGFETFRPLPKQRIRPDRPDPRQRAYARSLRAMHYFMPELARIHPMEADDPQECLALLWRTFASGAWRLFGSVTSFEDWLVERGAEMADLAYAFHKDQLKLHQHQRGSGRWLLKSPAHLDAMPGLLRAYPDAVVVRTHRDLRKVVPSTCSLLHAVRRNVAPYFDPKELGPRVLSGGQRALHTLMAPLGPEDEARVVDVRYADLVESPVATVERIYKAMGAPLTDALRDGVDAWLDANPKNKHGAHHYDLETYGLDGAEIDRLAADYYAHFDIPRENDPAAPPASP